MSGYSKAEIIGKNCRFLQRNDTTQKSRYIIKNALQPGRDCFVEIINYRKDGTMFWNGLYLSPVKNDKDIITHYIGTQNDISERKLKEIELKFKLAKSEQLQKLKAEFVSSASHELRTPLTSVKASMQLLSRSMNEKINPQKQQLLLNKANVNINKLTTLVESLLAVSSLEAGRLLSQYSVFSIADIIRAAVLNFDARHEILLEGEILLEVSADRQRIEQVMFNLLSNAIKYAATNSKIIIQVCRQDNSAKVSIKDFGIGIAADQVPFIFDRYYRGDNVGSQVSGLGLYISKEIIKVIREKWMRIV